MKSLKSANIKGFTLMEMMVYVAIVAIMSGAAIVGLGSISDTFDPARAGEIIKSRIEWTAEAFARGEFLKATFYFRENRNHLVITLQPPNAALDLTWDEANNCLTTTEPGVFRLKVTDRDGAIPDEGNFDSGMELCVDFENMPDIERQYQLINDEGGMSQIIGFAHFNSKDTGYSVSFGPGTDAELIMDAPHGKKRFYDKNGNQVSELVLSLKNENKSIDVTLQ